VQFRPQFVPAHGPAVEVSVFWTDKEGKRQQAKAQDWILNIQTQKPLEVVDPATGKPLSTPWVYGGSSFWRDDDGTERFSAEDGDFICVSNFTTAMLDLPVESSDQLSDLQFMANPERIPPVGTDVLLVLAPKIEPKKPAE
jgi:hypothetical protein